MDPFEVFKSKIEKENDDFKLNYVKMSELVAELRSKLEESKYQGSENTIKRHKKQGKLLARERIELLLDADSPFLELLPLAGWGQDGIPTGGSCICGIGLVNGVECMIGANVATIKGGANNEIIDSPPSHSLKPFVVAEAAERITQQAGADLTQQAKVFHSGGSIFYALTKRSKKGIPSISVVFGSSTAGGAYQPGLSDYVIMVKKQAKVYLAGPPLVKMATGEEIGHEALGGAEMHAKVSGVADYLAEDEMDALQQAREVVSTLNWRKKSEYPSHYEQPPIVEPPLYDPEELLGIAAVDLKTPYDSREVIARLVDGSRMAEFKPDYGASMVTVWARIHGFLVGIIANNGAIFSDTANKTTQFIEICDKRTIPLLFLHNVTGFMVGSKQEQEGIIKHGSKLINAVANRTVPAISIIIGASYGAGNYAMCGRAYEPRFLFAWPNAKIAVMGTEQLVGVMKMVSSGSKIPPEMAESMAEQFKQRVDEESSVWYCTSRMIDDGVIDPRHSRDILGMCLSVIFNAEMPEPSQQYGLHRM